MHALKIKEKRETELRVNLGLPSSDEAIGSMGELGKAALQIRERLQSTPIDGELKRRSEEAEKNAARLLKELAGELSLIFYQAEKRPRPLWGFCPSCPHIH